VELKEKSLQVSPNSKPPLPNNDRLFDSIIIHLWPF
jgi:hypothetical protein